MFKTRGYRLLLTALLSPGCSCLFLPAAATASAPQDAARLVKIVDDVRLVANSIPRAAALNDLVNPETPVRTGENSWAEIRLANEAIARLGQHTSFSFKAGTRQLDFAGGALLLQIPKKARGVRLQMAGAALEVSNTTSLCELHGDVYKVLVLQGMARLYRPGHLGDSILLHPGQMVIGQSGAPLSDPVDVDLSRFSRTSHFLTDFSPLPSAPLIAREAMQQMRRQSKKTLIATNMVIMRGGAAVSLLPPEEITKPVPVAVPASSELGIVEIPPQSPDGNIQSTNPPGDGRTPSKH